ncbi:prepilin-type N-terminal cleavage/methylation domain-containing protein [Paludisphaera soli]|uniref:prepilin-type N-terminal cleavage/methylation domain-containing protein n=1 Tax=Paludisphaera soli TaxID=2712865 RepID=UPI0013EA01EA|nr:prepilin-type N-terminal cleavage/methylation domain-containing protein [Paludisphaera soli]
MNRPTTPPSDRRPRPGFTLVELLVVLLIVGIIAAVALPVIIPAISHRQVSESARIVQGGLIAARDSALRSNTPHGIRFLPDTTYNGIDPGSPGGINRFRTLASNRFIPIEQPPGYREGAVVLAFRQGFQTAFTGGWPWVTPPSPDGTFPGVSSFDVYPNGNVLMIVQGVFTHEPISDTYPYENPTSWYWNVRKGDKIQVNNTGPFFTVVGPVDVPNPEGFINMDPANGPTFGTPPSGASTFKPEILFVVNGVDDDKDGYIDNGQDGVDNNLNGLIDDLGEWSEPEYWPSGFTADSAGLPVTRGVFGDLHEGGVPYTIIRRPVPSPGARETVLPSNVVVDLTTSFLSTRERSRLPVDPSSGTVDILLDSTGKVVPAMQYSSPSSYGMAASFYHIWLAERSDLAEVVVDTSTTPPSAVPLVSGYPFLLPMPVGQNAGGTPNAYDVLMGSNPTLPSLKGEMRLLTLFTRTGNLITTDRPLFNVANVNQPYHAPQLGEQGDAP